MVKKAAPKSASGTPSKVPITERALVKRINRALAKEDKKLVWDRRDARWLVVETGLPGHVQNHVERFVWSNGLENEAREIGVLKPWEALQR